MEFKLTVDVTPRLESLIQEFCVAIRTAMAAEVTPASATVVAEPEVEPEKPQEPVAEVKTVTYPDDEKMRRQMDIVISKFAGNGWKESKDARTLAIKKGCTSAFKEIAKWLGADKPTALEAEKRLEFVKRLDEIFIQDNGEGKVPEIVFRPF